MTFDLRKSFDSPVHLGSLILQWETACPFQVACCSFVTGKLSNATLTEKGMHWKAMGRKEPLEKWVNIKGCNIVASIFSLRSQPKKNTWKRRLDGELTEFQRFTERCICIQVRRTEKLSISS